jgi:hypothetical protein
MPVVMHKPTLAATLTPDQTEHGEKRRAAEVVCSCGITFEPLPFAVEDEEQLCDQCAGLRGFSADSR